MYTISEVLENIDARTVTILLSGVVALVGAYLLYIEGIRLGFRDKTHAIPIFANMYFFAHDCFFVGLYHRWFHEVNHWLFKLFWVALVVFTLMELVVHYQTLKYSRQELFPMLTQGQYVLVYLMMQAGVAGLFWFTFSMVEDPLFLILFATTEIVTSAFLLQLLLLRRNAKGQSRLLALGALSTNVGYVLLMMPLLASAFARPVVYMLGAMLPALMLIYMWALRKKQGSIHVTPPEKPTLTLTDAHPAS